MWQITYGRVARLVLRFVTRVSVSLRQRAPSANSSFARVAADIAFGQPA